MKIQHWKLIRRHHTPAVAAECAVHRWESFTGVYIVLESTCGHQGMGEASPLLNHSPETTEQCVTALTVAMSKVSTGQKFTIETIDSLCRQIPTHIPAARFALETALLGLLSQTKSVPLWSLLTAIPLSPKQHSKIAGEVLPKTSSRPTSIITNGLLGSHEFKENALKMFDEGIRTFKVKVGKKDEFSDELSKIKWLRKRFGSSIEIRLDANGAIPKKYVIDQMKQFAAAQPSFIEEPTEFDQHFPKTHLPFPFAADESLVDSSNIQPLLERTDCTAFVLKPSLVGGIFQTIRLAALAENFHKQIILTHMFESMPGFMAIAHTAAAIGVSSACGLYPHEGIGSDFTPVPYTMQNGALGLNDTPGLGINVHAFCSAAPSSTILTAASL